MSTMSPKSKRDVPNIADTSVVENSSMGLRSKALIPASTT